MTSLSARWESVSLPSMHGRQGADASYLPKYAFSILMLLCMIRNDASSFLFGDKTGWYGRKDEAIIVYSVYSLPGR